MPTSHAPPTAAQQPVELLADVGRGQVDVADDPGDERRRRGQIEQLLGLADVGHGLHDDACASMPASAVAAARSSMREVAPDAAPSPRRRSTAGRAPRGPTRGGGRRPARVTTSTGAPRRAVGEAELGDRGVEELRARRPAPSGPGSALARRRTGSVKCSCRWSTYSIHRPSVVPLTATKSNIARCWTISHRPTPPACGHTGTPNLAASRRMARFSLTPPTRQASICTTSIASACSSCLKITRFCTCSPVATRTGRTARGWRGGRARRRARSAPRSSTGRTRASCAIHSIAWPTPQRWLASRAMRAPLAGRDAGDAEPADVGLDVGADLQLEHREPVGDGLAGQPGHLVVVVAEPSRRRRVGRKAVGLERRRSRSSRPVRLGFEDGQRFARREGVVDVGEVDLGDDLLRVSTRRAPATAAGRRGGSAGPTRR